MAGRENAVQMIVSAGTPALALAVASAAASTTGGTTVASSAASLSGCGRNHPKIFPDVIWT